MLPADRSLQRETEAAKRLIENMPRDDAQLLADSIEGETIFAKLSRQRFPKSTSAKF